MHVQSHHPARACTYHGYYSRCLLWLYLLRLYLLWLYLLWLYLLWLLLTMQSLLDARDIGISGEDNAGIAEEREDVRARV